MSGTVILDFDGTMYETPCTDIPKLEDAIDLSMLQLLVDKITSSSKGISSKVLQSLDILFSSLDKTAIGANLYNQNAGISGCKSSGLAARISDSNISFSSLLKEIRTKTAAGKASNKTKLFCARALAKMMHPTVEGNHRVSGMLNIGLDITQDEIAAYYRKYATIKYKSIKPNKLIRDIVQKAIENGDNLIIYTDNSKENIITNLATLGYDYKKFVMIVDMFDCGGFTKKTKRGRDTFSEIMKHKGINLQNAAFYDDNTKICEQMARHLNISSYLVNPDKLAIIPSLPMKLNQPLRQ